MLKIAQMGKGKKVNFVIIQQKTKRVASPFRFGSIMFRFDTLVVLPLFGQVVNVNEAILKELEGGLFKFLNTTLSEIVLPHWAFLPKR